MAKVILDDKEYDTGSLSKEANAQLTSLKFVDRRIAELDMDLAALKTARMAYLNAVRNLLENQESTDIEPGSIMPDTISFE